MLQLPAAALGISVAPEDSQRMVELLDVNQVRFFAGTFKLLRAVVGNQWQRCGILIPCVLLTVVGGCG